MAIKKSDLYASLWASCDELRGGMDASQYKDYVLFMLFIKYISDKYGDSDDFAPPVNIPAGASFRDMIALKGKSDIGDRINTQVIQPLIDANARLEVARAYAVSKLGWIRDQQVKLREQAREPPRQFVTRESHYLWGKRYLLSVAEREQKPFVTMDHRQITLTVRPGSSRAKREAVMHAWYKGRLHEAVPPLIRKWEPRLKVTVAGYFLQRMKTKWGACNHRAATIRLNTELAKKPRDLLEYVVVHEMLHLIEPTHSERFVALLDEHYPAWREARAELNELPLAAEAWNV